MPYYRGYSSVKGLLYQERLERIAMYSIGVAILGNLFLNYGNLRQSIQNKRKITALDLHSHVAHGTIPVNSDREFLYLSGAWF